MDKKLLEDTVQSLMDSNKEYENKIRDNKLLIYKYRWEMYYSDIHKKQMEIINNAIDKDVFVFIYSVPHDINHTSKMICEEPEVTGFTLTEIPNWVWIAKLKSDEFKPFDNGYPGQKFLVGLTDCYFINRSHRTDEGKYRIGYKEHDNWGVFEVYSHRINIFNKKNFKDKEVLEYLEKVTNIPIK